MYIKKLDVHRLRNLEQIQLSFCPGANLVYGINGSGKTSLLEALYLLGRGRSFRSRNIRSVIQHDTQDCVVFGQLHDPAGERDIHIGVQRTRKGEFRFKVNGEVVPTAAALVEELPIQLLNSHSFELLEGGPLNRRQFLDWGVFHVEHEYPGLWKAFHRCLKHRNSLLRRDRIGGRLDDGATGEMAVWDEEFARLSEQVDQSRQAYLSQFKPVFQDILQRLTEVADIGFGYQPGWDSQRPLIEILQETIERDRKSRTSNYGAHRADLKVKVAGRPAAEVLSRGQIKTVVCALRIAQGYLYHQITGKQCVYLLDDLPAELDSHHRQRVGQLLNELGAQVFITGVFKEDLQAAWPQEGKSAMFHVEHGVVSPLDSLQ
ncbi:DNA replication/repair protein RecF [Porticoccus sp. W117]|uniref:DNA replication/repair protein RecF n=1 Tax=Porticoccus sp. W117 TaxID=3054777 RepID=UPI0025925901|nr:DNA replication/repair protein RecF [Porticoccus sp. W117]MDM3870774.1 DNA replication/repair protein RecF [Porticoccus sp. W117]